MSSPPDARVRLDIDGPIATITNDNVEKHNAFDDAMDQRLFEILGELMGRPDVRAVIWRGEGKSWSSGRDVGSIGTGHETMSHHELMTRGHVGIQQLFDLPAPVIVAFHGWAIGGSFQRALLCDIRIAAEGARFMLPETTYGVIPDTGGVGVLFQMAGHGVVSDMVLTGRPLSAEEALHQRRGDDVEQRLPALEQLEQAAVRPQLVGAGGVQEARGATDEDSLLLGGGALQHRAQDLEERPLRRWERRVFQSAAQTLRTEPQADDLLVEIRPHPVDEPGINGVVELEQSLRHRSRRCDDDRHHDVRLNKKYLHVAHSGCLDGRCGHERQQSRELREHVRRRLERRLQLAARLCELERKRRRTRLEALEQAVGEEPIAVLRGHAAGRSVRMREQALPLELGELAAHPRRCDGKPRPLDERLRRDPLAGRDVLHHNETEELTLSLCEHLHYVSV